MSIADGILKKELATLINDDWFYSMHWKDGTWRKQAREDIDSATKIAKKRLSDLEKARRLLYVDIDTSNQ